MASCGVSVVTCPACAGTGEAPRVACAECGGKGCDRCKGKGTRPGGDCARCEGRGKIAATPVGR